MKNFKRIIIALIVACVIIASCPVSGSVVDAKTISIKNGNAIEEITINKKSGKVTTKDTSHKAGWYKKSGVQYYFGKNKKIASYKWQNKTLYKWQNGSFKKYTGTKRLSNDKSYYFNKGKKANGIVKKSGKYYYYKGGKQTVYSKSCDKWKTGKTQYYFGKGNKSATYVYYSDKKTLKKWNKTKKSYQKYTGVFTLSDGKTYRFSIGKRGTIKSSITAGTDKTTAVYKNAKGNPENVTGWKQVKDVRYYFNKAATASFKIEKDVCYVFVAKIGEQSTDNLDLNGTWKKYSGVVGRDYYVNGKVDTTPEKDTITTDQSGLLVKYDGKEWKLLTGTYKKLYYVNGDYASGIVDGKYYRNGKLATGICENKYYKDGVLGTGSYNGKRYSKGSLLTGDYKNKFYKNGELYTGMRKSNGKYYVNGELATGSYENKYYKDGELYTGVYKSKYYKDGILDTGTCNGKFYKDGELYTGIRKSNGKYYVDGVLANGTYDGVKYVDGVAQSNDSSDKDEEKLTEGEFRTNSGKLQHCEAVLYTGDIGTFPNLWNFRDGKLEMGIESTFNVDNYVNFIKRDNKYYHLEWVDYTGEYKGKLYESGKAVDYKVRTKSGDLFTGWAIYEDVIPNAATEFYHLTTGKSHNLVYVENGAVKQYYVYEGMEDHSWCNGCGADMEVSPYWSSAGVNPALDDHKEHDHPEFDHQSFNGGPVYKYTNNGKTYWVTNPHSNYYRWNTRLNKYVEHYIDKEDYSGRVCVDSEASDRFNSDLTKFYVVYSASDWKVGQSSVVVVENDIVLK